MNALSLTDILNAESDLSGAAPGLTPAANPAEPLRPVHDGTLVTSTFTPITPFPRVNKPLLITTVNDEAGFTIYGGVGPGGLDPATYEFMVDSAFGQKSATTLLAFADYAVPASANSTDGDGGETDVTPQLQQMGTDQVWRCPSWTFARNWVSNGGRAFVGEFVVGASYPGNEEVPFCTDSGVVCHQDDIEIVVRLVPCLIFAFQALNTLSCSSALPQTLLQHKQHLSKKYKHATALSSGLETPTLIPSELGLLLVLATFTPLNSAPLARPLLEVVILACGAQQFHTTTKHSASRASVSPLLCQTRYIHLMVL